MKVTCISVLAILAAASQATVLRNPEENEKEGLIFMEGDILVSDSSRNVISDTNELWDLKKYGGNIPFVFDTSVSAKAKEAISEALVSYERETCIKWVQRDSPPDTHYLKFISDGGCYSYVGEVESLTDGQPISIGTGCEHVGYVIHEIAHALGLYHEQSRSDRDDYIEIRTDNINSQFLSEFSKSNTNNYGIPYDYYSVLHFRPDAFTSNGEDTLISLGQPGTQFLLGQREYFSFYDKKLINTVYCIDSWADSCGSVSCNEGYITADCTCECPPGTEGESCETVNMSYYDYLIGKDYSLVDTIGSASATPSEYIRYTLFEAPYCQRVVLSLSTFEMICYDELVQITGAIGVNSLDWYCGSSDEFTLTSEGNTIVMETVFWNSSSISRGWTADVSFVAADLLCWIQLFLSDLLG